MSRANPVSLALALICLATMWLYTEKHSTLRLIPVRQVEGRPYPSDLLAPWEATVALLDRGQDPYAPEVTHSIQRRLYGRELGQSDPTVDQQRFAYPVYTVLFLASFRHLRFDTAANSARFLLPIIVSVALLLWLSMMRLRRPLFAASAVTLALASWPVAQGIALQQLGLVLFLLISAAIFFATRAQFAISGFLLSVATIKPQAALAPAAWLIIWSFGDFRSRWKAPAAFLAGVLALAIAGEWILPGWIPEWLATVRAYSTYAATGTLLGLLFGPVGTFTNLWIAAITVWALWKRRKVSADSNEFVQTTALAMAVALFLSPVWVSHSQVALIPAAILVWISRSSLQQSLEGKLLFYLGYALQIWTWIGVALIIIGVFPAAIGRVRSLAPATIGLPIIIMSCLALVIYVKPANAAPDTH